MKSDKFDYPFPNGVVSFWILSTPAVALLLVMCRLWLRYDELNKDQVDFLTLVVVTMVCLIFPVIAMLLVNSYPAVRVGPDGLEARFYFPCFTKWVFLPWARIDTIVPHLTPADSLFGLDRGKSNSLILSRSLPAYYQFPSMVFGRALGRGFFITRRIKRYDEVMRIITIKANNDSAIDR